MAFYKVLMVFGFVTASSIASAETAVDGFLGTYELKKAVIGYCEPFLSVRLGVTTTDSLDLRVGSYYLPKVNGGPRIVDDQFEQSASETIALANIEVSYRSAYLDKLTKQRGTRLIKATLIGGGLQLVADQTAESPFPDGVSYKTECMYSRSL